MVKKPMIDNSFKIERKIPMPPRQGGKAGYPFGKMKIGDSFALTADSANRVRAASSTYGRIHKQKFTVRKDGENYRCWRAE